MGVYNIIQVSGSNTLPKAATIEDLKRELRDHVVKVNDALRRLSQLVYTPEESGGVRVIVSGSGSSASSEDSGFSSSGVTSVTETVEELASYFYLRGERTPSHPHPHLLKEISDLHPDSDQFILANRIFGG